MANIKKPQYDHVALHFTVTEPYVTHCCKKVKTKPNGKELIS